MRHLRSGFASVLALAAICAATNAQHEEHPAGHPTTPAAPSSVEQKRGSANAPTHAPHLKLPPQAVLAFVRASHAAFAAATAKKQPPPAPAVRPSGAGRYLCAVVTCSDLGREMHSLLGLRREDVLVISVPGPFLTPEVTATLERQVHDERLSLVLVLSHDRCATLAKPAPGAKRDALTLRVENATKDSVRRQLSIERALAEAQRELLLASSEELATRVDDNTLRVIGGEVNSETGTITWLTKPIDELPMPPVK